MLLIQLAEVPDGPAEPIELEHDKDIGSAVERIKCLSQTGALRLGTREYVLAEAHQLEPMYEAVVLNRSGLCVQR
jgi:hypothetical protein